MCKFILLLLLLLGANLAVAAEDSATSVPSVAPKSTSGNQLRDPTQPSNLAASLVMKFKSDSFYKLQSILYSQNRYSAVINNQVVQVGDQIDNYEVIRIDPNEVELVGGLKHLMLRLYNTDAIQISTGESS